MSYTYPKDDPHWVQADAVEETEVGGYVNVTVDNEKFKNCKVGWSNPWMDKTKSDVLVQDSQGNWLKVWFFDKDIAPKKS